MTKIRQLGKLFYLVLIALHLLATIARGQGGKEVLVIDVEGPVTPVMQGFIERAIEEADVVVDLVAYANPSIYMDRPLDVVRLNYDENLAIVRDCAELDRRLLQFSSCEVYGMTLGSSEPFREDETPLIMGPVCKHRWIYACAKQLLERIIHAYGLQEGLRYTIVRPFNFIGPKIDYMLSQPVRGGPRVFSHFLSALLNGWPLPLVDGGRNRRSYTYIADAIDAVGIILENRDDRFTGTIVNVGNPANETTIADLARLMHRVYQEEAGVAVPYRERVVPASSFYGEGYEDCDRRVPDVTRLLAAGWRPRYDLEATVRESIRYYVPGAL
jgi:nucleoside-diphosphate-sugar epimerase